MPGVGLAYCGPPETHHFFVQAIEKENKLRRKTEAQNKSAVGDEPAPVPVKKPVHPPVSRVQIPISETPPDLAPFFPKLQGRDPASFSKFLLQDNPMRVSTTGRLNVLPELASASQKHRAKIEHHSETARNFSQGHRALNASDLQLEEEDYMQAFNNDICKPRTEFRRKYKEFTLMADAATRSRVNRYTLTH
mmetsp:Transcript_40420/g.49032  ORF Transcript_40420/g.49032 Transcript_40420/m.49032 type:complete len:192 (+) Transcript_40420:122-697(+)